MNQAARTLIYKFAAREVAQQMLQWRRSYRRGMVNPIELHDHLDSFAVDDDQAWRFFQSQHADIAALDDADLVFSQAITNACSPDVLGYR